MGRWEKFRGILIIYSSAKISVNSRENVSIHKFTLMKQIRK
jgi:hypothetical protein